MLGKAINRSTRVSSIQKLIDLKGFKVIDLGSNEGHNSFDFADYGAYKVVGVEIRDRFLEKANSLKVESYNHNVSFLKKDVRFIDEANLGTFDLCLCSGLLYHMENPFNLLKRIRKICKILMLETNIAPSSILDYFRMGKFYRKSLTKKKFKLILDGEEFTGRFKFQPIVDFKKTSGSFFTRKTFWLEKSSLLKALKLAGFDVKAIYYKQKPNNFPEIEIQHGLFKSKIFIYAETMDINKRKIV